MSFHVSMIGGDWSFVDDDAVESAARILGDYQVGFHVYPVGRLLTLDQVDGQDADETVRSLFADLAVLSVDGSFFDTETCEGSIRRFVVFDRSVKVLEPVVTFVAEGDTCAVDSLNRGMVPDGQFFEFWS